MDEPLVGDTAGHFDLLVASITNDARDLGTFLEVLTAKLTRALPGSVQVEREGGLFKREHPVRTVSVAVGDRAFELARVHSSVDARIVHTVRGVRLKSDQVGLDQWIAELSRQLAEQAKSSAEAKAALESLLI